MISNVGDYPSLVGELVRTTIMLYNMMVWGQLPAGFSRAVKGDIGAMHLIGIRVLRLDGQTLSEYATT